MKKLKLCNVHKLALSNEGEGRKPIHIPFGTWAYDDTIDQTLDREHAEKIASDLAGKIAAGEPGIPVYQGHPDVPEYASKYPDKGALGWIKRILVNENGMDLEVEWDRDPGKGFGWFSPFWTGDDPGTGATGKRNVIVDGLTSVGLVNNPNIREFRLANEAQPEERITRKPYQLPQRIIDLANEYDESKHPRAEDGKWTSGGSAAALSAAQAEFDTAKSELIAGQKRGWSKAENDRAFRRYDRAEKKLKEAKDHDKMIRASSGPGRTKQPSNIKDSDMIPHPVLKQQETKKKLDALWAELGRRFDDRMSLANVIDANGMGHSDENGQFDGSGSGGGGATIKKVDPKTTPGYKQGQQKDRELNAQVAKNRQRNSEFFAKRASYEAKMQKMLTNAPTRLDKANYINNTLSHERGDDAAISAAHRSSIFAGLTYNRSLRRYE